MRSEPDPKGFRNVWEITCNAILWPSVSALAKKTREAAYQLKGLGVSPSDIVANQKDLIGRALGACTPNFRDTRIVLPE